MRRSLGTYRTYSIGCALVWAAILIAVVTVSGANTRHTFLLVGAGWWIGWLSTTIARSVYPAPHSRHA